MNECAGISVQLCFSLQKPEEYETFSNILMPVKTRCNVNQDLFKGFSLMNYEL